MVEGYDRRTRYVGRVPYSVGATGNSPQSSGTIHTKSESVLSWRDNVEGAFVADIDVDPYNGWLSAQKELKYDEQRKVQRELQRAGLPGLPDYEVKEFVDNGHPFDKVSKFVNTSLRSRRSYISYPGQGSFVGYPYYTAGATVSSSARSQAPFQLTNASYLEWTFMPYEAYPLPEPPQEDLANYGKRAISIVAPGRPQVDMFRIIGELLAGIPQMPGKALLSQGSFASTGDEWLNMLFGVMPTYDDGINAGKVLLDISHALMQYRRDAGRIVRRKMEFPEIVRSAILTKDQINANSGKIYAGASSYGFNRKPITGGYTDLSSFQVRRDLPTSSELFFREVRTIKFAGAFTYYIPTSPDFAGKLGRYMTELDNVIRLRPTTTNVYELTPWSWLFDWFVDVRSQLDLASIAFDDNLVVNYGYAMEHSQRSVVCKTEFATPTPNPGVGFASTYTGFERKRRIRANPYGFVGQTGSSGWNPFRWSILAALGISRLR